MTRNELKRYLELDEQIKAMEKELKSLKDRINKEFEGDAGQAIVSGILYGTTACTRTNTDLEALAVEIGVETISRFQSTSHYTKVFVKPTSKAI